MKTWITWILKDKGWVWILVLMLLIAGLIKTTSGGFLCGYRVLFVCSGSMEPAIPVGSLLVEEKVGEEDALQIGDVVTFRWPSADADSDDRQITHRIVRIISSAKDNQYTIQTKGDNNPAEDPFQLELDAIEGRVVWGFPYTVEFSSLLIFLLLLGRALVHRKQ